MDTKTEPRIHKWHRRGDVRGYNSAGQIAKAIRIVRSQSLSVYYSRSLSGDFPGASGREILHQFSRYCTNEINRRGGVIVRELSADRLHKKMRAHIRPECVWCGQPAEFHPERNRRFCSPECRRSYHQ